MSPEDDGSEVPQPIPAPEGNTGGEAPLTKTDFWPVPGVNVPGGKIDSVERAKVELPGFEGDEDEVPESSLANLDYTNIKIGEIG